MIFAGVVVAVLGLALMVLLVADPPGENNSWLTAAVIVTVPVVTFVALLVIDVWETHPYR